MPQYYRTFRSIQPDFPFSKGDTGYFKINTEEGSIRGRIIQLLSTSPGERVYLSNYGVGLKDYLLDPMDNTAISTLNRIIIEQFKLFEPSLQITNLVLTPKYDRDNARGIIYIYMVVTDLQSKNIYSFSDTISPPNTL